MSRLTIKLAALAVLATLGTVLAAGDDRPDTIKLTKLTEVAPAAGGIVSPDGKLLAVNLTEKHEKKQGNAVFAGSYRRVKLLDLATGKELAVIPGATARRFTANGKVLCVEQSFDEQSLKAGKMFAFASVLPMPQLWDVTNPQKPKQLFVVDGAHQESFSADGRLLLVAGGPEQKFGNAGKVVTGLPKTGNKGAAAPGGFPGAGMAGGAGIGFGGGFMMSNRFFELWEVDSARFVARYEPQPKGKSGVSNPVFSPDGKLVASVVTSNDIKAGARVPVSRCKIGLYDVEKKKETRLIDVGEATITQNQFFGGALSPEPLQFVPSHMSPGEAPSHLVAAVLTFKDAVELNLYDPATGKLVTTLHKEKKDADTNVTLDFCLSPDGKTLAALVQRRRGGVMPFAFPAPPGVGGAAVPIPAPQKGQNPAGGFGGGGFAPAPAKAANPAAPAPRQNQNGPAAQVAPAFGQGLNPFGGFGGRAFLQPPASGEIILFDLEHAKKSSLAVLPHAAQFASNSVLAAVVFGDKSMKLSLWDVASAKEIGGVDDCDLVHFAADGATMLTRSNDGNAIKVWTVEKAKK